MEKRMDLDDARTGSGRDRAPNVGDLVDVYKFPDKKWVTIRLMSGLFSKAGYWVVTKKRDGSKGKFPTPCPSYDPEAQERDSTIPDPWRDMAATLRESMTEEERKKKDSMLIQFTQEWYMPAIIRSKQKTLPDRLPKPTPSERKTGFKEKDSDSMTAIYAVKLGKSLLGKLQELKGLNTVESKSGAVKAFSVNDPKFGRDIRVYFDKDKAPADQYQVQLGEKRTPLTEDEQAMLGWNLEAACAPVTAGMDEEELAKFHKQVKLDFDQWAAKMGIKVKKSRKDVEEDEDFDEEDEDQPKGKRKPAPKGKRKPEPEDDDDLDDDDGEEDDDDFDEEEDDAPPAKKKPAGKAKAKPAAKGKRKPEPEDDDDFDDDDGEDDDLDDDDDDAPPAKKKPAPKKAAPKGKRKPEPEDDDDFDDDGDDDSDDDGDDDDFDDEPPAKKKPAGKAKPAPKGKRKPAEDDDFDDDDDGEDDDGDGDDDDFDDEPPAKKKPAAKGKAKPAAKGKRKPAAEDDDDDFDD